MFPGFRSRVISSARGCWISREAVASALLQQPRCFEGLGSLLEQPKASDLPVFDREDEGATRRHLDPVAPPHVGGVPDHDFGAPLRELMYLQLGILKCRPELVPEVFLLLTTAIDASVQRSSTRPVNFRVGAKRGHVRGCRAGSRLRYGSAPPRGSPATSPPQYLASARRCFRGEVGQSLAPTRSNAKAVLLSTTAKPARIAHEIPRPVALLLG
jgi:hypothetical protein